MSGNFFFFSAIITFFVSFPPCYSWNSKGKHTGSVCIFYVWGRRLDCFFCFLPWIITPVFINIIVKHSLYSKHHQFPDFLITLDVRWFQLSVPNVHYGFGHHNKAAGHKPSSTSLFFSPTRDLPVLLLLLFLLLLLLLPWVEPSPSAEP